jgi:hypothetical protein
LHGFSCICDNPPLVIDISCPESASSLHSRACVQKTVDVDHRSAIP